MSGIRVTYSGLISLIVTFSTVVTGSIFILIVTRQLSPEEFGTWGLIGALTTYVIIIEPIISMWALRETARGEKSGKTALVTSGMFSTVGIIAYLVIAYFVGAAANADVNIILFAAILVPFIFLNKTLSAINLGWKPQGSSYGLIGFEISKIPAGLTFVYFLDMGLEGAIIAIVVAYIISILILISQAREKIRSSIEKKFIIKWLKLSWLSLYTGKINSMIHHFDIALFAIMVGNVTGLAYWSAAIAISSIVAHSNSVSVGLYGKLLETNKREYFQVNFRLLLYFLIPLFAFAVTFARPGLFTLNPLYEAAYVVVIFLSVNMVVQTFNNIFDASLKGIEKVDIDEKARFKQYIKSNLFFLPTLTTIQRVTYIVTLGIVLFLSLGKSDLDLVINWSIVAALSPIPFMLYRLMMIRKNFKLSINYFAVLKYSVTAIIIFTITYILMDEYLIYKEEIMLFLPQVLLYVAFSVGGYLGITFLVDARVRELVKGVLRELKSLQR